MFIHENRWLFWLSFVVTIVLTFTLICFSKVAKTIPINYILLFAYTIFETYLVAAISIYTPPENVLIAAALTFAVFVGLTCFALFVRILSIN